MRYQIRDTDLGFDALGKALSDDVQGLVGIRSAGGGDEFDMAALAATLEFGTTDAGRGNTTIIPPRPAFRGNFDANKDRYRRKLEMEIGRSVDDRETDMVRAIDRTVLMIEGETVEAMVELTDPPNAPATIEAKGFDNPLVHTGALIRSVDSSVSKGGQVARPWSKATAVPVGGDE